MDPALERLREKTPFPEKLEKANNTVNVYVIVLEA